MDIFFQVIENLTSVKLLDPGIGSDTCRHDLLSLEYVEAALESRLLGTLALVLFDAYSAHASEEDLEYSLHVVYKHFLEVLFKFI